MEMISGITGPTTPPPPSKPADPNPPLNGRERENDFTEIRSVNEQINEIPAMKKDIEKLAILSRDERLEGIRKETPELYEQFHTYLIKIEFGIGACVCCLGLVASAVAVVSSFTGGVTGELISLSFPLSTGLIIGIAGLCLVL